MIKIFLFLGVLTPFLLVLLWHLIYLVHNNHRRRKLQAEREQKKLMAEDLAQLMKDTEQLSIGFTEYFEAGHSKRLRKQAIPIADESRDRL